MELVMELCIFIMTVVLRVEGIAAQKTSILRPHIVFFLVDDLGWNDVSFHGSPEIPTPNIDALASDGILLNKHYVQQMCTPSRAALLSGRYPIHLGMQSSVIQAGEPWGMAPEVETIAEYLKTLGYSTHALGKWHLGYFQKEYTPTYQGFDSFFGFWNGRVDYYDHTDLEGSSQFYSNYPELSVKDLIMWGLDLHDNLTVIRNKEGCYSTEMYTDAAVDIISRHNQSQPLFLYLAHQAVHAGNDYQTHQAPDDYVKQFHYIQDKERRTFAGMVAAMDESVGRVFIALHQAHMLNNCIFVFSTDNGGSFGMHGAVGSNWPLRGKKGTLWEGGVRGTSILWSPLLKKHTPRVSTQLMHISDWLPTLFSAAGGDVDRLRDIDGIDLWNALSYDLPSPRKEILLNIDPLEGNAGYSALLWTDLKLVVGNYQGGRHDAWYGSSGRDVDLGDKAMNEWVFKDGSLVGTVLKEIGRNFPPSFVDWRRDAEVRCGPVLSLARVNCNASSVPCLYNITADPCEYNNLADTSPQLVEMLLSRLRLYSQSMKPPRNRPAEPVAQPSRYNFSYVSWRDNSVETNASGPTKCPRRKKTSCQ